MITNGLLSYLYRFEKNVYKYNFTGTETRCLRIFSTRNNNYTLVGRPH